MPLTPEDIKLANQLGLTVDGFEELLKMRGRVILDIIIISIILYVLWYFGRK